MRPESFEHLRIELEIIAELEKQGTIDQYSCEDISRMADERWMGITN